MHLRSPTGTIRQLMPGVPLVLGRADLPPGGLETTCVSRQQCRLLSTGRKAELTSLSRSNPTVVFRRLGTKQELIEGQRTVVRVGDNIALLAVEGAPLFQLRAKDITAESPWLDVAKPCALSPERMSGTSSAPESKPAPSVLPEQNSQPPAKRVRLKPGASAPVMLILVGVPGAGKTTWCGKLCAKAMNAQWTRVNQDSIASGKRGSKEQCLTSAEAALAAGRSVLIDRTHANVAQRREFLALAKRLGVPACAVVLNLPAMVCAERAAGRTDHEGHLQGPGAKMVVYRMHSELQKGGLPTMAEGFTAILVCDTDSEVAAALAAWGAYSGDPAAVAARFAARRRKSTLAAAWGLSPSPAAAPPQPRPRPGLSHAAAPVAAAAGGASSTGEKTGAETGPAPRDSTTAAGGGAEERPAPAAEARQKAAAAALARAGADRPPAADGTAAAGDSTASEAAGGVSHASPPANAFLALMSGSQQQGTAAKSRPRASPTASDGKAHVYKWGAWAQELHRMAMNPERFSAFPGGIAVDDDTVCFKDGFPKAQHHALVVSRLPGLEGPDSLRKKHIPHLQHMQAVAKAYISKVRAEGGGGAPFRLGFHAVPSMRQLHLHVISQDLSAAGLKNKKHWHSFTAPGFFLPLGEVLQRLEAEGQLFIDPVAAELLLKGPMQCHRCRAPLANMPTLKQHIQGCPAPYNAADVL
mmetsp:Transcript_9263/g.27829  ORF Transcript_9263/g.27829 Transcript_9263/m.27829 type:complete len:698 (+) Transcript_9263:62-2155(+)